MSDTFNGPGIWEMSGRIVPSETWRADFKREFMRKAFKALWFNGISGDYLEFGSCGGMTFTLAYEQSRQVGNHCKLWSFDSFQGLPDPAGAPDEHPRWQKGAMSMSLEKFTEICQQHKMPASDYQLVPGYYSDTIGSEDSIGGLPHDVALAYIDCDLYSSTKIVLSFLGKRLKHGMIIAFDDYYCFSKSALSKAPPVGSGAPKWW